MVDGIDVRADGSRGSGGTPRPSAGSRRRWPCSSAAQSEFLGLVTEVIGRERLVTLCGPAGCGKSRLAMEVGRNVGVGFDGVSWIELSRLDRGEAVPGLVRQAIGAAGHPTRTRSS